MPRKDVQVLECAQRRATKLLKGLGGASCEEQLRVLCVSSLEKLVSDVVSVASFHGVVSWSSFCDYVTKASLS